MGSRSYCFTINNYSVFEVANLSQLPEKCKYLVWQFEKGDEEETPHMQGYVEFNGVHRIGAAKEILKSHSVHLEKRKGTRDEAREYCMKDDTRDTEKENPGPFEFGVYEAGGQGSRTDLLNACNVAKETKSLKRVAEEHPVEYVKFTRGLRDYINVIDEPYVGKVEKLCFVGPTGTGKSYRAMTDYGRACVWSNASSSGCWFDEYDGEETIILDDFRGWKSGWKLDYFLKFTDNYTKIKKLPIKGGFVTSKIKRVIVTSPGEPHTWFADTKDSLSNENITAQIERRFPVIKYFTEIFEPENMCNVTCNEVLGNTNASTSGSDQSVNCNIRFENDNDEELFD